MSSRFFYPYLLFLILLAVSARAASPIATEVHTSTSVLANSSVKTSTAAAAQLEAHKIATATQNLKDVDPQVRAKAASELIPFGSRAKRVAPLLASLLTDRVAGLDAARALAAVDSTYVVSSDTLRHLVRRSKAPIERERVRTGWALSCEPQNYTLDILSALGPIAHAAIPDIVRLSRRSCIHEHVMNALQHLGTPDGPQMAVIAEGMQDTDPEIRQSAIEYLARAAEPNEAGIRMLGRAMNDSDSRVRLSALQALEDVHPEGEGRLPLLAGFMKDSSPEIRQRALYMVGQLGPSAQAAIPLLHEGLKDPLPVIALASAKVLAGIDPKDETLINLLIQFSKSKNVGESTQAAELLESLQVHNARIDAALEPYRSQQALSTRLNHALSDYSPEQLAENARTLKVEEVHMASGLQGDKPIHVAKHFSSRLERLYCWTEISVGSAPASLMHRWYRNGKLVHESYLDVTQPQMRLWSTSAIRPGEWRVDIIPAGLNEPLATALFTVTKN